MTYQETIERLEEMRPRFEAGFSTSDRLLLDELHTLIFHKPITITGCADCYRDAYLLIKNYLKKNGTMPEQTNYRLLRGMVIHEFGSSEYYTLDVSDEVAENYLIKDQTNIKYFERFPDDWQERITRRIAAADVNALETDNNTTEGETASQTKKKSRSRK